MSPGYRWAKKLSGRFSTCHIWRDDIDAAARILGGMIDYARRDGMLGLLPLPLAARAELRWRTGDWPGAITDASESLTIVEETEQYIERAHCLMVLGKMRGVQSVAASPRQPPAGPASTTPAPRSTAPAR